MITYRLVYNMFPFGLVRKTVTLIVPRLDVLSISPFLSAKEPTALHIYLHNANTMAMCSHLHLHQHRSDHLKVCCMFPTEVELVSICIPVRFGFSKEGEEVNKA
jgi:hypothetical protein